MLKVKKSHYYFVGTIIFLFFVFFSYLVHKNLFTQTDFDITVHLQDHISRRFDTLFSYFSVIGSFEVTTTILVIFLIIRRKLRGIGVLIMYGVIHLFELYGKYFVNHRPPPHFMLRTEYPINFPQFYVSTDNSYPSGHAGRALFVTTIMVLILWKSKRLGKHAKFIMLGCLLVYDVTMLVSRIYLGEHWTSDVIGGALLGASLALFSIKFI